MRPLAIGCAAFVCLAGAGGAARARAPALGEVMSVSVAEGLRPASTKVERQHRLGLLIAKPRAPESPKPLEAGALRLPQANGKDAYLYVPKGHRPYKPTALLVLLHGAGGNAKNILAPFRESAERRGVLLLAPQSQGSSWDVIRGGLGPDVAALDALLAEVFARTTVDVNRLAIGGFSDGASYALTLGIPNGELFRAVFAFSPGFDASPTASGKPHIFVTHGTRDAVLPIEVCSRRIVPALTRQGYEVTYSEFNGPHMMPEGFIRRGVDRLADLGKHLPVEPPPPAALPE